MIKYFLFLILFIFSYQVIFEGEGFLEKEMNVAIDDVIVKTEKCSLKPYFAKPGNMFLHTLVWLFALVSGAIGLTGIF